MFRPIHFLLLCCFTIHVKAQETQLNKGIRAYEIQDYDRAIEQLDSALLLCTSCHDSILAKIEMYRGKYFQYIGRHERAYPAYENGMQYARKSGSQNIKFWANVCLAEFMRSREKLDSAMVLLDGIKEQIKDPAVSLANKGYYYNRLGAILLETKSSPQKLKEVSDNALSIFSELKDTLSMASTLNVLGRYFEDANLLTEAESTYERAVQLLSETENKRDFVDVIINYSSTCRKLGKYNKSIDLANKGLSLCDSSAAWHEPLYYLYIERAISYEQLGDMRQAFDNISLGYKHSVKYLSQRYNDQIARVSKQLDLRNKEIALQDERLAKQQVEANLLAEQKSKNTFRAMLGIVLLILGTIVVLFFRLRKLSNQQKQLIEEKEYLIREVHHRVKNNLQSLSSLAGLQMIHAKTQDQKEVLEDFSKRLDSISLTHTMLYQSQSLKDIPAKEYLQKFTQSVLALDSVDSHNSRKLKLEVDEIALSFTEGVSLGMITNELLSNTIKHNANRAIQINLELLKEGDQLCFHYYEQENGAGDIAQHEKAVESTSLGLKLIDMFIKKLKAQRLEAKSPFGVSFQFVRHAD